MEARSGYVDGLPKPSGQEPHISECLGRTWGDAVDSSTSGTYGGHRPGSPKRSGPVWCLCEGHRPPVRASAGTNFAASTVPQPLARSYPGVAS